MRKNVGTSCCFGREGTVKMRKCRSGNEQHGEGDVRLRLDLLPSERGERLWRGKENNGI